MLQPTIHQASVSPFSLHALKNNHPPLNINLFREIWGNLSLAKQLINGRCIILKMVSIAAHLALRLLSLPLKSFCPPGPLEHPSQPLCDLAFE